ncbi:MAG: hypothetical protein QHH00_00415 [Methanomassiliicoccales archaeon]|jgi:hypothetical protein|nr:hypothetical protein [Methanomassiliicoccales archaeon]
MVTEGLGLSDSKQRENASFSNQTHQIRPLLIALLSLAGFTIVVVSSIGVEYEWLPETLQFGLLEVLPIYYWIGIFFIVFSVVLSWNLMNEHLFLLVTSFLFLSLWCAPVFFERYPSIWDSYSHFVPVSQIAMSGGLKDLGIYSYAYNYPGMFVVTASYEILASVPSLILLKYYPLFSALFTLLALYFFIRTYVPSVEYRYALFIAILGDVWIQLHFSPQSIGFAVGLFVFVFLERQTVIWTLIAIFAFLFIVISHPTTVLFVLGGILIREIYLRMKRVVMKTRGEQFERTWPFPVFFLIWFLWLFTGSITYSTILLDQVVNRLQYLVYLPMAATGTVTMRTAGNIFSVAPLIRLVFILILLLQAFFALLLYAFSAKKRRSSIKSMIIALIILPIAVGLLDIVLFKGQLYDRGLLFLVLSASIIVAIFYVRIEKKKIGSAIGIFLIFISMSCASTLFYQEGLYIVSEESFEASDYINQNIANGSFIIGGFFPSDVWSGLPPKNFYNIYLFNAYPLKLENFTSNRTAGAIIFDRTSELWYRQYGMEFIYQHYVNESGNYNKVFDNGAYWIIYKGRRAG